MKIHDKETMIHNLICYRSMVPYALTMTFLLTESIKDFGDDIFYNEYLTFYNNKNDRLLTNYNKKIEDAFRLILNALARQLMSTRNITRNSNRKKHPITFYEFQLSNRRVRKEAIHAKPSFMNVSPLHIHGTILVPKCVDDRFQIFVGQDTIHKLHRLGQGSEIKRIDDNIDQWLSYASRDYLAPSTRETVHPSSFSMNPEGYWVIQIHTMP